MGTVVGLAIGIVILATIATIGIVVLGNFASSQGCSGIYTFNATDGLCYNGTPATTGLAASVGGASAYYAENRLGNGTGGLLTWLPVIIPAVIGISIIGYFLAMRGREGGY